MRFYNKLLILATHSSSSNALILGEANSPREVATLPQGSLTVNFT